MSRLRGMAMCAIVAGSLVIVSLMAFQGSAAETGSNSHKKRVYIELTEDFYQALKTDNNKRYTTNPSDDHLRQIAISTRFMVETNLQILERQEQIIKLLEKQQGK